MKPKPIHRYLEGIDGGPQEFALQRTPDHLIENPQIVDTGHISPVPVQPQKEKQAEMEDHNHLQRLFPK
jgi:hypothetical protein